MILQIALFDFRTDQHPNTLYCVQLPRAPVCCFVGWSIRLCSPNSALFRFTEQSDHIRGRPGAHPGCGCQGGGGGRLEYFEPRLFRCKVYPNCSTSMYQSLREAVKNVLADFVR